MGDDQDGGENEGSHRRKNRLAIAIICTCNLCYLRKVRLKKFLFRDKKHKGEGRSKNTPPGSDEEASPEHHEHSTVKVSHTLACQNILVIVVVATCTCTSLFHLLNSFVGLFILFI